MIECNLEDVREIGEGSFGIVFSATNNGKREAFKTYKSPDAFLNNLREIDTMMRVQNSALSEGIRFYPAGSCFPSDAISSKLKSGSIDSLGNGFINLKIMLESIYDQESVDDLISYTLMKLLYQMCQALDCLQRANIYHLDVKPSNILYDLTLEPFDINFYLTDFGFALPAEKNDHEYPNESGTLAFISPETINFQRCTNKSDVWSLGLTMISCIVEKKLFKNTLLESSLRTQRLSEVGKIKSDVQNFHDIIKSKKYLEFVDTNQVNLRLLEIISKMLQINYTRRPSFREIMEDPLFTQLRNHQPCTFKNKLDISCFSYKNDLSEGVKRLIDISKNHKLIRKYIDNSNAQNTTVREFLLAYSILTRLIEKYDDPLDQLCLSSWIISKKFYPDNNVILSPRKTEMVSKYIIGLGCVIFINPLFEMVNNFDTFKILVEKLVEVDIDPKTVQDIFNGQNLSQGPDEDLIDQIV